MRRFTCSICGYVYDEAKGIPADGITQGTKWEDIPDDWVCPLCGASKNEFIQESTEDGDNKTKPVKPIMQEHSDMKELSALEVSVICSNLRQACEKMHKSEEAAKFGELAQYFKAATAHSEDVSYEDLLKLIQQDLDAGFPNAEYIAKEEGDRGALRSLTWTVKASRMLKSILSRYEKEGDAMLENTGVYVCSICGYIYIGDDLPEVCPVCKVPNWKFDKIEGGAA